MTKTQIEIENLKKALTVWDPDEYDTWVSVGMAIKASGFSYDVWDEWSRTSSKYYDEGNDGLMQRKWDGFSDSEGNGNVTIRTIFWKARNEGMTFSPDGTNEEPTPWERQIIPCDAYIASCYKDGTEPIPDTGTDVRTYPSEYPFLHLQPWVQTLVFLRTLFDDSDVIEIVSKNSYLEGGKWKPRQGRLKDAVHVAAVTETLTTECFKPDVLQRALGALNPKAGVWVSVNNYKPESEMTEKERRRIEGKDGYGYFTNDMVKNYRYALVESDTMDAIETIKTCMRLRLPIVTVTLSGGKSAHVIVRIDAVNLEQYKARTAFLFRFLKLHGMELDQQDKNASRLTRLPGVMRDGTPQTLVLLGNMLPGCFNSYETWEEYAKRETPEMKKTDGKEDQKKIPTLERSHTQGETDAPTKNVELIQGVMLQGGVMEVIAPPKAGKTHFMMQLGMDIAQGLPFVGYNTTKSKVYYLNVELTSNQFERRVWNMKHAIFADQPEDVMLDREHNFLDVQLKGMGLSLTQVVDAAVQQWKDDGVKVIIVDPIYPLMEGDENGTQSWRAALKDLDRLGKELGVTVMYVHHTTKGEMGAKNKRDQGAGSGMQARHGDEILALMELEITDELRESQAWDAGVKGFELAFTSRDFDPAPKRIYFKDGYFHEDTDGILQDCSVIGSEEYNARKTSEAREKTHEGKTDARKQKALKQEKALVDAIVTVLSTTLTNGGTASEIAGELLTQPVGKGETLKNLRIQVSSLATGLPDTFTKKTDEGNHVIIRLKAKGETGNED